MENLLNYTSDSSSDDNSNIEIQTTNNEKSDCNETSVINSKNKNTLNFNTKPITSNSKNGDHNKKETALVIHKAQPVTTTSDYSYTKSSEYIQNQFMSLPPPKYHTTSYSDLGLDNELPPDDEQRLIQTQKNIQHALQEENKRKREELYQSYRTSAQLNGMLDKPVRPYVSKRLKKNTSTGNNHQLSPQASSIYVSTTDDGQLLTEHSKKVLYINSSYLSKPSSDYLQTKKFTHIIPSHTTGQLYGHTKGVNVLRWKPDDGNY